MEMILYRGCKRSSIASGKRTHMPFPTKKKRPRTCPGIQKKFGESGAKSKPARSATAQRRARREKEKEKAKKKTKLLQYRETCKRGLGRMSWDTRLPSPRLATFDRVGLVLRDLKLLLDMGCACELIMYG